MDKRFLSLAARWEQPPRWARRLSPSAPARGDDQHYKPRLDDAPWNAPHGRADVEFQVAIPMPYPLSLTHDGKYSLVFTLTDLVTKQNAVAGFSTFRIRYFKALATIFNNIRPPRPPLTEASR